MRSPLHQCFIVRAYHGEQLPHQRLPEACLPAGMPPFLAHKRKLAEHFPRGQRGGTLEERIEDGHQEVLGLKDRADGGGSSTDGLSGVGGEGGSVLLLAGFFGAESFAVARFFFAALAEDGEVGFRH